MTKILDLHDSWVNGQSQKVLTLPTDAEKHEVAQNGSKWLLRFGPSAKARKSGCWNRLLRINATYHCYVSLLLVSFNSAAQTPSLRDRKLLFVPQSLICLFWVKGTLPIANPSLLVPSRLYLVSPATVLTPFAPP